MSDTRAPTSRAEQKLETRRRILDAAGRAFRRGGLGGSGVDGLAKEAGVTSGAFYLHFDSKSAAFRESVVRGVSDVATGVKHFQAAHGASWWREFVRFYLGEKRKCDLSESCGLQSLASDVARADESARGAFTAELLKVATAMVSGPATADGPSTVEEAHAALATLIGAVTLPAQSATRSWPGSSRRRQNRRCCRRSAARRRHARNVSAASRARGRQRADDAERAVMVRGSLFSPERSARGRGLRRWSSWRRRRRPSRGP